LPYGLTSFNNAKFFAIKSKLLDKVGLGKAFQRDYRNVSSKMCSYKKYKFERREVLTETILILLADLPVHKKEKILEDDTPEELVDFCKMIYDSEFDNNVETLGISGADEIAYQEALGIFELDEEIDQNEHLH